MLVSNRESFKRLFPVPYYIVNSWAMPSLNIAYNILTMIKPTATLQCKILWNVNYVKRAYGCIQTFTQKQIYKINITLFISSRFAHYQWWKDKYLFYGNSKTPDWTLFITEPMLKWSPLGHNGSDIIPIHYKDRRLAYLLISWSYLRRF